MASVGAACGLNIKDLGFIYFDAHDDLDSPDVNENGYFDAMGLSMLRGESWKTLINTVPGYHPMTYRRFLHCGLRDQSEIQRQRVIEAGMTSIWGETERKVDFAAEMRKHLESGSYSPGLVHLDLDVLDESYGKSMTSPHRVVCLKRIWWLVWVSCRTRLRLSPSLCVHLIPILETVIKLQ